MKLKEFVMKVLKDVVEAVEESKTGLKREIHLTNEKGKDLQTMEFDIAVTVESGDSTQGGAGVNVALLNVGGATQSDQRNSTVSRIRFGVYIDKTKDNPIT